MLKLSSIIIISLFASGTALAQTDTAAKHSTVKTLTDKQYNAYLKGVDVNNFDQVAMLNHYPAPDKVLLLKKELSLSPTQIFKINEINAALQRKKVEMGGIIIKNERTLDSLFRTRKLNDGIIIFYTNRYGIYQGELRNAILQACYKTEVLLSAQQIKKFESLQNHHE